MEFEPRNILVIDFGQLGDVVMSLPALRAIRSRFPDAKITVLAGKPAAEVLRLSGYSDLNLEVDRVALRDGSKLLAGVKILKLIGDVRKAKYDFVIDLNSLSETNLLGFVSGAPLRLYSRRPRRSIDFLSNFEPRPPAESKEAHLVDRYLQVLEPLGIENAQRTPRLKVTNAGNAAIEVMLKKQQAESGFLLVGLFPGAGHPSRRWPLERFAELADFLTRNDRVRVVVFAGPEETKILDEMKKLFPVSTIFLNRLTIEELASAQARLSIFISNDTGPMHIAAAVGTAVIVIGDRLKPNAYTPIGDQHKFIGGKTINDISVEQVYKVAHELLSTNRTEKIFSFSEQR